MPAVELSKYIDFKDKHDERVGDWAVQVKPGMVRCQVCPSAVFSFSKGKEPLIRHSENQKHRDHLTSARKDDQVKIADALGQVRTEAEVVQCQELEIALGIFFARHCIPHSTADCLMETLRAKIPDSRIVQRAKLGREKLRYLVQYGLGEHYEEETIEKLRACDAFGVAMDESEVNKKSELEILVNIASPSGTESRHYKTLDLEAGDAETICSTLTDEFIEDKIEFKEKMVSLDLDGCSTMQGHKTGVITRMEEEVHQLSSLGSSNAHNICNAMSHGVTACAPDVKEALVDLYMDLGGAKGKGLKKKKAFERLARSMGISIMTFKRFVQTRFRSLRTCIEPVLHNYLVVVAFYKDLKKPSPRQQRLQAFFVERCDMTRLTLHFIFGATASLTSGVDFFEKDEVLVHCAQEKMKDLLFTQMKKFVKEDRLYNNDEEGNKFKKSGRELLRVEVDPEQFLPNTDLFIGQAADKDIKSLGLTPSSPQLSWFFNMVKTFHSTVNTFLQKYFETGLRSDAMVSMRGLAPGKHSHKTTAKSLKVLVNKYSKVIDNIKFHGGMDLVMEEIDKYTEDEEVGELDLTSYQDYWHAVANLKDGTWSRYEVIPRFAFAMGAKYNDTSSVERKFSEMNLIHQNKQRNCMSQSMLDAHLHIIHGVESKENIEKCDKCEQGGSKPHCHCSMVEVNGEMRARCRKARLKVGEDQQSSRTQNEAEEEKAKPLKAKTEKLEKEREQLKTKATFYSERVMSSRIYGKKDSKKGEESVGKGKQVTRKVKSKSVGKSSGSSTGKKNKRASNGKSSESSKKLKK